MKNEIRYLLRKDIEEDKWNRCIHDSINGLCYSDSNFLDTMSTEWSALVLNDYEAVMPLTWRRKFGVDYLYQPVFCQQTGITMINPVENIADDFLSSIPGKFRYWDIQLNAFNLPSAYPHILRKNFLLSLAPGESELKNKYHRNAIRNIRKAREKDISVTEDIPPSILMQFHISRFATLSGIALNEYKALETLLGNWTGSSRAKIIGAKDTRGNIIATSGYLIFKNRITFIVNGNHPESLTNGASHLLKDHMIRKYSGTGYILDFEGSDNPDFARFYQQFGGETIEYYPRIKLNKLRWPFSLLKK